MNTLLTLPFARSSDRARQCQTASISQKHHRETNRDTMKTDKVARTDSETQQTPRGTSVPKRK